MSPAPMTKDGHATTTSWPAAAAASATSSPRRFVAMYGYWRARSGNGDRSSSGRSGLSAMPTDATLETCTTRCTPADARGGEHVLDAADVDRLHVRALGLEVRDDAREVVDGADAVGGAHEALAVGDVSRDRLDPLQVEWPGRALQHADPATVLEQARHEGAADEAGRAGHQNGGVTPWCAQAIGMPGAHAPPCGGPDAQALHARFPRRLARSDHIQTARSVIFESRIAPEPPARSHGRYDHIRSREEIAWNHTDLESAAVRSAR